MSHTSEQECKKCNLQLDGKEQTTIELIFEALEDGHVCASVSQADNDNISYLEKLKC